MKTKKNSSFKKLLALSLISSVLVIACCSFEAISMISGYLGQANAMGLFGDGELSQYMGIASVAGGVTGMAGNMAWPGGGIGGEYGTSEGFGLGHSTDTYQAATSVLGEGATEAQKQEYLNNMSWQDKRALDNEISGSPNSIKIEEQLIKDREAKAAAAINNQGSVTSDVKNVKTVKVPEKTNAQKINETINGTKVESSEPIYIDSIIETKQPGDMESYFA